MEEKQQKLKTTPLFLLCLNISPDSLIKQSIKTYNTADLKILVMYVFSKNRLLGEMKTEQKQQHWFQFFSHDTQRCFNYHSTDDGPNATHRDILRKTWKQNASCPQLSTPKKLFDQIPWTIFFAWIHF